MMLFAISKFGILGYIYPCIISSERVKGHNTWEVQIIPFRSGK